MRWFLALLIGTIIGTGILLTAAPTARHTEPASRQEPATAAATSQQPKPPIRAPQEYAPSLQRASQSLRPPSPDDRPIATDAPPADAPRVPPYDRRAVERAIFDEINRIRNTYGAPRLVLRKDMARTGRKYAKELMRDARSARGNGGAIPLRHRGSSFGETVVERLRYKKVYDVIRAGENIVSLPLYDAEHERALTVRDIATRSVHAWLLSPTHRANMLNAAYDVGGIGIAQDGAMLVAVAVFAQQTTCGYYKGACCEDAPQPCFTGYFCDTARTPPSCRALP